MVVSTGEEKARASKQGWMGGLQRRHRGEGGHGRGGQRIVAPSGQRPGPFVHLLRRCFAMDRHESLTCVLCVRVCEREQLGGAIRANRTGQCRGLPPQPSRVTSSPLT